MYVHKVIEEFENGGMKLSKYNQKKLIEMKKQITKIEAKAQSNINEFKDKIAIKESDMDGVS